MALHSVARFADLREDRGTPVEIGSQKIILLRVGAQVRAYQGQCPHAGAPLAEGSVCNGRLICPWHKAGFAVSDGQLCEPPALDGLTRYPVEVVDGEVRVSDQPLQTLTIGHPADARLFVVIGAGAAGTAAVAALREQGYGGRLLLIDSEAEPGYDRTALSKFVIAGDMPPEQTPPLRDDAFYLSQNIERIHARVQRLDVRGRRITLADGRAFSYHAALLASGGEPHTPDIPGVHLEQVLLLRSREDARQLLDAAQPGTRVVIVGASFIGLEAASSLRKRGLEVTVLMRQEVPFARQFGERIGRAILQLHRDQGVVFQVGEAKAFLGTRRVEAVQLDNGEVVAADLVLLGTGVHPATAMVSGLALHTDGAVSVDAGLQAASGLWAAGDIARFPLGGQTVRIEHWRVAQQQARIAASNMLGADLRYADVPFFWTYYFGKRLEYLGHPERWERIVYEGEPESFEFVALLCHADQVVAVVGCQRERATAWLAERMLQPLALSEALLGLRHASE